MESGLSPDDQLTLVALDKIEAKRVDASGVAVNERFRSDVIARQPKPMVATITSTTMARYFFTRMTERHRDFMAALLESRSASAGSSPEQRHQ